MCLSRRSVELTYGTNVNISNVMRTLKNVTVIRNKNVSETCLLMLQRHISNVKYTSGVRYFMLHGRKWAMTSAAALHSCVCHWRLEICNVTLPVSQQRVTHSIQWPCGFQLGMERDWEWAGSLLVWNLMLVNIKTLMR